LEFALRAGTQPLKLDDGVEEIGSGGGQVRNLP
jgi:hypothetical protein